MKSSFVLLILTMTMTIQAHASGCANAVSAYGEAMRTQGVAQGKVDFATTLRTRNPRLQSYLDALNLSTEDQLSENQTILSSTLVTLIVNCHLD